MLVAFGPAHINVVCGLQQTLSCSRSHQIDILDLWPRPNPASGKTFGSNAAAWWWVAAQSLTKGCTRKPGWVTLILPFIECLTIHDVSETPTGLEWTKQHACTHHSHPRPQAPTHAPTMLCSTHACTNAQASVHARTYTLFTDTHSHTHAHAYIRTHTHTHTRAHTHTDTHRRTHARAHKHARTNTPQTQYRGYQYRLPYKTGQQKREFATIYEASMHTTISSHTCLPCTLTT
jgi:hypothetical protein